MNEKSKIAEGNYLICILELMADLKKIISSNMYTLNSLT